MDDIYLSAPNTIEAYYKLFSQVCIKSVHNYYGCYGISEIIMHQGQLDIFYNKPYYIEICGSMGNSQQWWTRVHSYE